MQGQDVKRQYDHLFELLKEHQKWISESITLIASENVPSPAVREAILSDFGNRYAEGWPGERVYAGCKYIDQVEIAAQNLGKELFGAEFVDVRPIAGVNSNLVIYTAFTDPGDRILSLSIPNGGHITYGKKELGGTAGAVHGLVVENIPFDDEEMNIDVDRTKQKIESMIKEGKKPKMIVFGGSVFLFPHPLKELSDYLKSNDILTMYDGAHVLGLIAGGQFQDPLREGADFMTGSTHKTLPGPQGGIVVSFNKFSDKIKASVFPSNTSNHHLHHMAAKAVVFAEMLAFGKDYATNVIRNAQSLAEALSARGLKVIGGRNGFTKSHQVLVDVTAQGGGWGVERELEDANIILNRNMIPSDIKEGRHFKDPGGIRMGTQELTRLGMGRSEMEYIGDLIYRIVVKKDDHERIRSEIGALKGKFPKVSYAFDNQQDAYSYITLRR